MMTKNGWINALKKRLLILGWLALIALFIGQVGQWLWILELFSHFTPYYTVFILLACFGATNRWLRLFFILTALVCIFWISTPFTRFSRESTQSVPSLRIVSYNLWLSNPHKELETKEILQKNADILFLTEATPAWEKHLRSLEQFASCSQYEDSPFGLALFSRYPMTACEVLFLDNNFSIPYIRAVLSQGLVIYGLHPPPPLNAQLALERDAMLEELALKIQAEDGDVIVLGDMNITAFSPVFREFTAKAQLHLSSSRGRPTWKPGFIGIDHILVSNPDALIQAGADPWLHSDHRAIWIDYALPAHLKQ
ncbi:MAG: endonuclease/exonuclease/phosphatase family protein [Saezia sp.]